MSSWISQKTPKKRIMPNEFQEMRETEPIIEFIPTFHILIATAGKPCLITMLNSLKYELSANDAITIVFDGENSLNKSGFNSSWLDGHKAKINIIEQAPNLGFWGHGIRNEYQGKLLPKTTFILNADDDDMYILGTFQKLRKLCTNPNTLYIAKFTYEGKNVLIPSQNVSITQDDIGTPCGIVPFDKANKSTWVHRYGGDFDYYNNLKDKVDSIKFLDTIIYKVL